MIRSSKCGIYMMVCSLLVLQLGLVSDIQINEAKPIREFKHTHTSHIFDVQFDLGRIVRYVSYNASLNVMLTLCMAVRLTTRRYVSWISQLDWMFLYLLKSVQPLNLFKLPYTPDPFILYPYTSCTYFTRTSSFLH